ncbi:MAG: hypothetical protein HFG41_08000 [Coprococcus sp.]|nr:hypothetical protein [Coprococcus sp.]
MLDYSGELTWLAWKPDLRIILELTDSVYVIGSGGDVTITCSGRYPEFVSAAMDGVTMDSSQYQVKEGSTVLTMVSKYLDTLSVGSHTVTLNYTYGSIDTNLKILDRKITVEEEVTSGTAVNAHTSSVNTGDESSVALWLLGAGGSSCVCFYICMWHKKRKGVKN